uniref:EXS domain-containing protein n=1 Tax=Erpetoichthys calabaricus TaxID=27687 RepID=A0A8C4XDH7_ERPCA
MKFSEHLAAHLTPEWRKQYICYGVRTEALLTLHWAKYDASLQEMFFQMCERELVKISLFYLLQGNSALSRPRGVLRTSGEPRWRSSDTRVTMLRHTWKRLCSNLFIFLLNCLLRNREGVGKEGSGAHWDYWDGLSASPHLSCSATLPSLFLDACCFSHPAFRASEQPLTWPLLRLYRGGFLLIEFIFLLGINIYGWKKAGVNHILIFELDPRDHLSYQHMFELAGVLGVSWCISLLACLHSTFLSIPLQLNPLLFYGFALLLLLNPTRTCYYRSRLWLLRLLGRVLTAPFHKVGFADFWLADQLISLSPLLLDLWSLICFYAIEVNWHSLQTLNAPPTEQLDCSGYSRGMTCLIQCFPPWIRFAQCLRRYRDTGSVMPHLFNAGKYSTVFIMVTFAAIYNNARGEYTIWVYVHTAIATITWDLRMDWGLVRGQRLLREETVYSHAAYYYCAMLLDVLLRVSWALNVSFAQMKQSDTAGFITTVLAPLEVFRRFIWNFFRLENEHLNNCGQFRAVRDISITPLTAEGQAALERLMDQEDRARESRKQHTDKETILKSDNNARITDNNFV